MRMFHNSFGGLSPRLDSVLATDILPSLIEIAKEIEAVYNDEWKNRGVHPYDKKQLQNMILNGGFPVFEHVNFTAFKRSDIPEFLFDRIVRDTQLGINSTALDHSSEGEWIHVYEANKPVDSLLLMAIVNMILKTYVRRRLYMPQRLTKITQLHKYHYDLLNNQEKIDSIHQIILDPIFFDKLAMSEHLNGYFHKTVMIQLIINNYVNMPLFNTMINNYATILTAPPLGDITSCLYHLIYQEILDRHLEKQFPDIVFTRWGNEVFILNEFNSEKKIEKTDLLSFLDSLDHIKSSQVNTIHCIDGPQKLYGFENPFNGIALTNQKNIQISLHECGNVTVRKHIAAEQM